jgi:phage repressor protein C with HTH and peptisase S24 domain
LCHNTVKTETLETAKERLLEILKHTGKTINGFSEAIGLKRSQGLYDIRDEKIKSISSEIADKIIKVYPKINLGWILYGEGSMLSEPKETYTETLRNLKNNKQNTLTYYNIGAAAGPVGDILPVNKTEGKIYINDLFRNTQFAVRISGNSMTPGYPPGAIVGIKEIQDKQISPGTVYVIEKGNDLWIKRLFYKDDKRETGKFELISDNTMRFEKGDRKGKLFYPAFDVNIDEVRVFKVTGIFKSNDLTVV